MVGDGLARRLRQEMDGWGLEASTLASILGWTNAKVEKALGGLPDLEDLDLIQLGLLFRRPPHYFPRGPVDAADLLPGETSRFLTLYNFCQVVLDEGVPEELWRPLWTRVMHGPGARRQNRAVTATTWREELKEVARTGRYPYREYFT